MKERVPLMRVDCALLSHCLSLKSLCRGYLAANVHDVERHQDCGRRKIREGEIQDGPFELYLHTNALSVTQIEGSDCIPPELVYSLE